MIYPFYKKSIGIGLIILFTVCVINMTVGRIPLMADSISNKIRDIWFIVSQALQAITVLCIAFKSQSQASAISKIGAILYTILMLIYISNGLTHSINGNSCFYFPGVSEYINMLVLYAPGLLFLVWGLPRLWLPIKLVTTLNVVVAVSAEMIWVKLVLMYQNISDKNYDEMDHLQDILDILLSLNMVITIALLVLTIIWIYFRNKSQNLIKDINPI